MKSCLRLAVATLILLGGWLIGGMDAAQATTAAHQIVLHTGVTSTDVGNLQALLATSRRRKFFRYPTYTMYFGPITTRALKQWQHANHYPVTGSIVEGGLQWKKLVTESTLPVPPAHASYVAVAAAVKNGWAVDASKVPAEVQVLHFNRISRKLTVTMSAPVGYAGWAMDADGVYRPHTTYDAICILQPDPNGYYAYSSDLFNAPMHWATYCDAGQAFHQDPITVASHGCIHIESLANAKYLYDLGHVLAVIHQ